MQALKFDPDSCLIAEYNYAQNLQLPKLPVNDQLHKHLLWFFVFSVHLYKRDLLLR